MLHQVMYVWMAGSFVDMNTNTSATLVAIAKNEAKYIVEWIAYNLAVGFDRIVIYSNDSTDRMCDIISKIASRNEKIVLVDWPSVGEISPQISAYNHAISMVKTEWVSFLDVDEFIVPFSGTGIKDFLSKIDGKISSVHVNWRNFGSSGHETGDYGLVTQTFRNCAPLGWGNHHHFKSLARTELVVEVHIHDIVTRQGLRVLSDMGEFETVHRGLSNRIVHHEIQINHYQCKTYPEFKERMLRGDANFPSKSAREHTQERFNVLDRNEELDKKIDLYNEVFIAQYNEITSLVR